MPDLPEDATDRHVARWRGHWVLQDQPYDDTVEAVITRMQVITAHLDQHKRSAAQGAGLEDHEHDTLHRLMISETPGTASPTALAKRLRISPAGMSGRLASMEKAGYLRRTSDADDRRRLGVEVTQAGIDAWRRAIGARGNEEERILDALTTRERDILSRLLKKVTVLIESEAEPAAPAGRDREQG